MPALSRLPKPPAWYHQKKDRALHAAKGKEKFVQICASCHGPEGKGDGPAAAALIDIWKNPLTPADLSEAHHKSGDEPTDLYRTIATGLDGTPMTAFLATLKPEEIWSLVAYIKSIEKAK
jgi:mono/diheme cytochrome c family protein